MHFYYKVDDMGFENYTQCIESMDVVEKQEGLSIFRFKFLAS